MMTSFAENIPTIVNTILELGVNKILDIGPAFGKYPLMFKEAIASKRSESGDLCPNLDDVIVDGLEYAKYFKEQAKWLEHVCNNVYWEDMFDKSPDFFDQYQLITMIDVVEHHPKEKILELINKIHVPILISTPNQVVMYPEEHYGFDRHCSQWYLSDFNDKIKINKSNSNSIIIII